MLLDPITIIQASVSFRTVSDFVLTNRVLQILKTLWTQHDIIWHVYVKYKIAHECHTTFYNTNTGSQFQSFCLREKCVQINKHSFIQMVSNGLDKKRVHGRNRHGLFAHIATKCLNTNIGFLERIDYLKFCSTGKYYIRPHNQRST